MQISSMDTSRGVKSAEAARQSFWTTGDAIEAISSSRSSVRGRNSAADVEWHLTSFFLPLIRYVVGGRTRVFAQENSEESLYKYNLKKS